MVTMEEPLHHAWNRWTSWYLGRRCPTDSGLLRRLAQSVRLTCSTVTIDDTSLRSDLLSFLHAEAPECHAEVSSGAELVDPYVATLHCPVGVPRDDPRQSLHTVTWDPYMVVWALWVLSRRPEELGLGLVTQRMAMNLHGGPVSDRRAGFEALVDRHIPSGHERRVLETLITPDDRFMTAWAFLGVIDLRSDSLGRGDADPRVERLYVSVHFLDRLRADLRLSSIRCDATEVGVTHRAHTQQTLPSLRELDARISAALRELYLRFTPARERSRRSVRRWAPGTPRGTTER